MPASTVCQARLVTNTRLQREGQPPRLVFVPLDYPDEHGGLPKATIYLGLNQVALPTLLERGSLAMHSRHC